MRRSSFSRSYGFGHVLFFFVICAILLIIAASGGPKGPGFAPQIALGIPTLPCGFLHGSFVVGTAYGSGRWERLFGFRASLWNMAAALRGGNAFVGVSIGSLLFGMAALATRGLAVPIGLHAMWNVGQWILGEKELPGLWKVWMEDRLQTRAQEVGMVSYLLGAGIAILGFWWRYRKNRVSESRS